MSKETIYYYLVSVSLPATWKENIYTYQSSQVIPLGTIVSVPFGKDIKLGFVLSESTKPKVKTKELSLLTNSSALETSSLKLIDWLNKSYPSMPGLHTQLLLPSFIGSLNFDLKPTKNKSTKKLEPLTKIQTEAINQLTFSSKPQILHGITGSGKTRVYQELAARTIGEGKNVLIIYPEISLTSHISTAFERLVPKDGLHVYHSQNKPKEQKKTWLSAFNKSTGQVFVGPRSALFLPIVNLGLIIVDEAHDSSLKQDSGSRYNGLMVAGALAKINNAKLIFGSATPPLQETKFILTTGGSIVCMHELALVNNNSVREFEIIDMTDKSNLSSSSHLLSKALLKAIKSSLAKKKQSLIFLNRRGTAGSLICESCGWHAECKNCENPQTYHHDSHSLICHICGRVNLSPSSCPECSQTLKLKSPGTKAIETELSKLFPNAKVVRFDSDNKKSDSISENYQAIRDGDADIIIGTQLITKGLDLPRLETVGILRADSSLLLPDFSSRERSFQQLTQVSGRAGRGHIDGKVILQSYNPNNELYGYVINQDWHKFYDSELLIREKLDFPPYKFIARVWSAKATENSAKSQITKVAKEFSSNPEVKILGPAPSFYTKASGKYSWQIILICHSRTSLAKTVSKLPRDVFYDLDPVSIL